MMAGENSRLILTNDAMDRAWRCDVTVKRDYQGKNAVGGTLTVYGALLRQGSGALPDSSGRTDLAARRSTPGTKAGAPFKEGDIKAGDRVRIFEFGKGSIWRAPSKVALRRLDDGTYRLQANVG
jgi:hypothetical protein